ncbi:transposase [candidate division KSB1 bacterium]|nr:transposase [candidate division KSB1 bacterium]
MAPYIFRVAISDKNILHYDGETVTFRYKDAESKTISTCRLNTFEFMRRFLQHVLPKGFVKVRYYGFPATKKRADLDFVKELIGKRYVEKKFKTIKNEKSIVQ